MNLAPIVIFAYNRPHYLKETLIALRNNAEAANSDLFVFCDGPKANSDEMNLKLIKQVRDLARSEQWCKNVHIKESEVNKGLAKSIISGVTEIIELYGKIIVLEDDIVQTPFFLKYMNDALEVYKDEDKVASISGHNFPIKNTFNGKETLFLKSATTWGWATWKRGWDLFNPDAEQLINLLKQKRSIYEFDFDNSYQFYSLLKKVKKGKINSWGVCWYASVFLSEKLTLFPAVSMIKNIGMIGTNINSDSAKFLGDSYYESPILKFEAVIEENPDFRKELIHHFKANKVNTITLRNLKKVFLKLIKKAS